MGFDRVNNFLANIETQETEVILDGSNVMKNIVVSEIMDISRLSKLSSELIGYLSKDLKRLPRKEQQSLWRDIEAVNARKEDFIFKIAQEANKSETVNRIFDLASKPKTTVLSENGEVFESSITEENRTQLTALLVDLINDKTRE